MAPSLHQPTEKGSQLSPASNVAKNATGLLIPKAKAPSRSMSQLWNKRTLEDHCPNPSPRIQISTPGPEQESSDPALLILLRLATEDWRCPGPQAMTLINSTEPRVTLTVTDKLISFLIDTGATYSAMTAYSGKPRSLSLCYGDWQFNICAMNNRCSTLNTWRNPIFPFFSHTPKMPQSYSWERSLRFKTSITISRPPSDLSWLTLILPITHPTQKLAFQFRALNLTHCLLSTSTGPLLVIGGFAYPSPCTEDWHYPFSHINGLT